MAEKWFVCSSAEDAPLLAEAVGVLDPGAVVRAVRTPDEARTLMLAQPSRRASALVGPGCGGMAPVNLAAAIAADGHADEVVLVERHPSGSLRSRAARAGVTRVASMDEMAEVARAGRGASAPSDDGGAEGPSEAEPTARATSSDVEPELDEPDCGPRVDLASSRPDGEPDVRRRASDALLALPSIPRGRREGSAPVIVFASGRGGVGKTMLASLAAACAESWGMRVAALDLDLGSGNLSHGLGVAHPLDLALLSRSSAPDKEQVRAVTSRAGDGLFVLGPCERPEMAERVAPLVPGLLSVLSDEYDLVIVDTSTTWTDAVAQAVQAGDRLLLVSDEARPSPASLARAASLAVRLGVARTRIMRVTNRCDPRSRADALLHRADVGLETARELRVLEGGPEAEELLSSGHLVDLAGFGGDLPESLSTALAKVLEELGRLPDCESARAAAAAPVPRRPRGLFARMREVG